MKWLAVILVSILTLSGCNSDEQKPMGPEDVAVEFFKAIYVDEDVTKAQQMCVYELSELLQHYRNINAIKRHLIGMELKQPTIEVKDTSADFFRRLSEDVHVELHFTSRMNGRIYRDVRIVNVIKEADGIWRVEKIQADPFSTNG